MPAGTIALTNNSTAVTGTGTSFTAELKANDFVVAVVGGVAYTLGIKSVDSNTTLTLAQSYTGPAASGLAWTPVPFGTMTAITAQLAAQVTYAVRGFNLDKANWQGIFTGTGTVTVMLPDGTSWQGPAWGGITSDLESKANSNDVLTKADNLSSVSDKVKAWGNIAQYGTTSTTAAQGNDSRITGALQKTGGDITGGIRLDGAGSANSIPVVYALSTNFKNSVNQVFGAAGAGGATVQGHYYFETGAFHSFRILMTGTGSTDQWTFRNGGGAYGTAWNNTSDERIKSDKKIIDNALDKVNKINGYTYNKDGMKTTGLLAQELEVVLPEVVSNMGRYTLKTDINGMKAGDTLDEVKAVSYGEVAGLLVEAIKELSKNLDNKNQIIEKQSAVIAELQNRMKAIDGLDA